MLTLYRLHTGKCSAKRPQYDRTYRRCTCPIHVEGMCGGRMIRTSTKLRDWQRAQRLVAEAEARDAWEAAQAELKAEMDHVSRCHVQNGIHAGKQGIADAVASFLREAERNMVNATLSKYKLLFRDLAAFCQKKGYMFLTEITLDDLREFRESWFHGTEGYLIKRDVLRRPLGPRTAMKKLERLRSFYRFALESGWVDRNIAKLVRAPSHIKELPKLPFTPAEMTRILTAAAAIDLTGGPKGHGAILTNDDLIAFILVLRWSGLRIGDASLLTTDRLEGSKLFLYTQKTGTHVYVPLPPFVIAALEKIKLRMGKYYFARGDSTRMETASELLRRKITRVFRAAGIKGGNPHRFRHTFAVELLKKGVKTENVAILLGHSSARITEQYYSAWIQDRQELLEGEVSKTWPTLELVKPGA